MQLPANAQAVQQLDGWGSTRLAEETRAAVENRVHRTPLPPLLLVRSQFQGKDGPRWCIFIGCHLAMAHAAAEFDGKFTDPA
eukprot:1903021-Heterocapsa_arctica.AAC.1